MPILEESLILYVLIHVMVKLLFFLKGELDLIEPLNGMKDWLVLGFHLLLEDLEGHLVLEQIIYVEKQIIM